jgi:molybdopterin-binding protein
MKISARNRLKGKIVDVKKGVTAAHVRIDVSASITNAAVEELGLMVGRKTLAIFKASDVIVAIPTEVGGQQWFA